jgi:hypothetical protein
LALIALRYAAGELDPAEVEMFESRLGGDQEARDALAEAVRLSAAASGVAEPTPDPLLREAVRERLRPTWWTRLLPRRPYRGHPAAWVGLGGLSAALLAVGIMSFQSEEPTVRSPAFPRNRPIPLAIQDQEADGPILSHAERRTQHSMDLTHPKLNPMGMQDHSPMATHTIPNRPAISPMVETPTIPMPMPATDPRVESKAEQEPSDPMAAPGVETKKG